MIQYAVMHCISSICNDVVCCNHIAYKLYPNEIRSLVHYLTTVSMSTSILYRDVLCVLWGRWLDRIQVLSTVKLPSCTYLTPVTVSYRSSFLPVVGGGRDNFSQIVS